MRTRLLVGTAAMLLLAISGWVVHRASAQNTPGSSSLNGQPLDGTITGVVTNDEGETIQGASPLHRNLLRPLVSPRPLAWGASLFLESNPGRDELFTIPHCRPCTYTTQSHRTRLNVAPSRCVGHPPQEFHYRGTRRSSCTASRISNTAEIATIVQKTRTLIEIPR